jgi:hypothetical protein
MKTQTKIIIVFTALTIVFLGTGITLIVDGAIKHQMGSEGLFGIFCVVVEGLIIWIFRNQL